MHTRHTEHYDTLDTTAEIYLSEKKKLSKRYFEDQCEYYISTLVIEKFAISTARNYYAGKRNVADFEYLEDLYGMQNPIDLGFINIIKPRINALIGLNMMSEPDFRVAYVDQKTIKAVVEEKKEKIKQEISIHAQKVSEDLSKRSGPTAQPNFRRMTIADKKFFEEISKKYGDDYITAYQTGAQSIINMLQTDSEVDFANIKKEVAKDYFVTGEAYTRSKYRGEGKDPMLEHFPPEDVFSNKPIGDRTFKNTDVVVTRKRLSPHGILKELGDKISRKEAEELFNTFGTLGSYYTNLYGGGKDANLEEELSAGEYMDAEQAKALNTGYSNDYNQFGYELHYLYHVEWLASTRMTKSNGEYVYREDRYECYRVGGDIYLGWRRCDEAPRRKDTPWKTTLSYTGVINTDPKGHIISMVNDMRELQDLYDILVFFRNNTIANSGVSGSRVNVAAIPKALGTKFMNRLTKWLTLRKQGVELVDPTEDGASLFQHYGNFDASINANSLGAIGNVLESLLAQADIESGVPRQLLGVIEERDAVENVRVGINQVSVLSLEMFRDVDRSLARVLQRAIDDFKYAYKKKPKEGVYRHGASIIPYATDKNKFSAADYKVSVISSGIENAKLMKIQQLAKEFVAAGVIDPAVVVKMINSKSVKEMEAMLEAAASAKKEEAGGMQQLQGQLEDATKTINQLQAEIDRLNNNSATLAKDKLALETRIADDNLSVKNRELDIKESQNQKTGEVEDKTVVLKQATVELEKEQLLYSIGNEKKVNNNLN